MLQKIKVMVVDDSSLYRTAITSILSSEPEIEVVGTAPNGSLALKKIKLLNPDVVTMDIEMPEMDGIAALREIKRLYPSILVIMFSVHTEKGAERTVDALLAGATDFIAKPSGDGTFSSKFEKVREQLVQKIKCCKRSKLPDECKKFGSTVNVESKPVKMMRDIVAIGSSTGGPDALTKIIPTIPEDFNACILIAQHMPPVFTLHFAERLNELSNIEVREAKDYDKIRPGLVLIAPGGYHMFVKESASQGYVVSLNKNAPENNCRPSADVLFRSVALHYKENAIGVIMTGMGQDGFLGLQEMKKNNAPVIAQNKNSCVVWGMPRAVVEAGLADSEVDLNDIVNEINRYMI